MLASVNAFYSRDMGRRITDGVLRKAKNGGTPTRVPLGYLNVQRIEHANDIRTVEVDPERAELIQWAFTAYATGEYTLNQLVEELYQKGLRTRPTQAKAPSKVSRSTLARLLSNQYYVGIVRYRGIDYEGRHQKAHSPRRLRAGPAGPRRPPGGRREALAARPLPQGDGLLRVLRFSSPLHPGMWQRRHLPLLHVRGRHEGKPCPLPYLAEDAVEESVGQYYGTQVRFDAEQVAALEDKLIRLFGRLEAWSDAVELDRHRRRVWRSFVPSARSCSMPTWRVLHPAGPAPGEAGRASSASALDAEQVIATPSGLSAT